MVMTRAGAEIVGLALNAFIAIWLSRTVGAEGLGYFAVTQTIIRFGGAIIGAGLPTVAAQRVAHQTETPRAAWSVVTCGRLILAAAAVAIVVLVINLLPVGDPQIRQLILLTVPALMLLAISSEWLLVASGRVLALSISRVLAGAMGAGFAFAFVRSPDDIPLLAGVIVVPVALAALLTVAIVRFSLVDEGLRLPARAVFASYSADAWEYLKAD